MSVRFYKNFVYFVPKNSYQIFVFPGKIIPEGKTHKKSREKYFAQGDFWLFRVEGEVYEVDSQMMTNLDVLEDHPK